VIINDPQDVEDVTMQQVYKYAELHRLQIVFNEYQSIQRAFDLVVSATVCKTERMIYDEMVLL
jgi:hypothetical protein